MSEKKLAVVVATYENPESAQADYDAIVREDRRDGEYKIVVGMVHRDESGRLHIRRHNTSTESAVWGGALLGAAIGVLVPPLGSAVVGGSLIAGLAAGAVLDGAALAGLGGIMAHFWDTISSEDIAELGSVLRDGEAGLVLVAVDAPVEEVDRTVSRSTRRIAREIVGFDIDEAYAEATRSLDPSAYHIESD